MRRLIAIHIGGQMATKKPTSKKPKMPSEADKKKARELLAKAEQSHKELTLHLKSLRMHIKAMSMFGSNQ